MKRRWWLAFAATLLVMLAFAAGLWLRPETGAPEPVRPGRKAVEHLLSERLTDVAGRPVQLSSWRGKPLVVNFWATWCPPCLKEMPIFAYLQKKYPEVQFVGIAADTEANVRDFLAKSDIPYPMLLAADGGLGLMADLGNTRQGLPFTVSIDAAGRARHVHLGGLTQVEAETMIADLKPR